MTEQPFRRSQPYMIKYQTIHGKASVRIVELSPVEALEAAKRRFPKAWGFKLERKRMNHDR